MNITDLLSTQFIVLALCIFAIVFVLRKMVEYILDPSGAGVSKEKQDKKYRFWSDVVLPILPILIGAGIGHIVSSLMMGMVAGLLASQVYRMIKSQLTQRLKGIDEL